MGMKVAIIAIACLLTGLLVGLAIPIECGLPSNAGEKYMLARRIIESCDELERYMMLHELEAVHSNLRIKEREARTADEIIRKYTSQVDNPPNETSPAVPAAKPPAPKPKPAVPPAPKPIEPAPIDQAKTIEEENRLRDEAQARDSARHRGIPTADDLKKQAEAERNKEARRIQKLQEALFRTEYREWIFLGGRDASRAKIVHYKDGLLTVERKNGKTDDVRISRLGKADRAFVDEWLKKWDLLDD